MNIESTPIANCPVDFRFLCPKAWEMLEKTSDSNIRYCNKCEKSVHLCSSMQQVYHHAHLEHCIAILPTEVAPYGGHYIGEADVDPGEISSQRND
jgi:hypothetical protein